MKALILALLIFATLTTNSFAAEGIVGTIKDVFDEPLEGVTVNIENSGFTTTTDASGNYVLDYIPGEFNVIYSKDGYTTESLLLKIFQKAKFPAAPIKLYPIPEEKGLFYVDMENKVLTPMVAGNYSISRLEDPRRHVSNVVYGDLLDPTVNQSEVIFIDRFPSRLGLTKVPNYGGFHTSKALPFGKSKTIKKEFIKDSREKKGKEQIVIRTAKLEPGSHAWVEIDLTEGGDYTIEPRKRVGQTNTAFTFYIKDPREKPPELSSQQHAEYIVKFFKEYCLGQPTETSVESYFDGTPYSSKWDKYGCNLSQDKSRYPPVHVKLGDLKFEVEKQTNYRSEVQSESTSEFRKENTPGAIIIFQSDDMVSVNIFS